MTEHTWLGREEALELAFSTAVAAGANEAAARALAEATVSAHLNHRAEVGFGHFLDYVAAYRAGRIRGTAEPRLSRPFPAFLTSDADSGLAQLGFDRAFDALVEAASGFGIAIFTQHNSFTTGELGYYVRRLAARGLIALAFTNANAFVAPAPGMPRLYSTNPLAFAYPLGPDGAPVVIDQSSSATAFVNLVSALLKGEALEPGMAVDAGGQPTTDPGAAMQGALLPFGGRKGANIALMVELMSAGLAGGAWSVDMPDFQSGNRTLDAGLTILAIAPGADADAQAARGSAFAERLAAAGVHVPGRARKPEPEAAGFSVPTALLARVRSA